MKNSFQVIHDRNYLQQLPHHLSTHPTRTAKLETVIATMSIPTGYSQGGTRLVTVTEDCRDYLRTGRCKYGSSCKYTHPQNVQTGGGVKGPVNPGEPMFPVRPHEPPCQYYMKHGTCKFGQACKFNHPSETETGSTFHSSFSNSNNGNASRPQPPQLVLNPVGQDPNGQGMVLQFLPQRPNEPDCIYFLKNGRCKYGATCRYHHPTIQNSPFQQQQQHRVPNQYQQIRHNEQNNSNVRYVTHVVPQQQKQQHHMIVTTSNDSPITNHSDKGKNGASAGQSYQIIVNDNGVPSYCIPTGSVVTTEQGSSTSSIASSYATEVAGGLHQAEQLGTNSENTYWSRRRNNSSSNLRSYTMEGRPPHSSGGTYLAHSVSEGNIQQRRTRSTSYGSASEHSHSGGAAYFENPGAVSPSNASRNSIAHGGGWMQQQQHPQLRKDQSTSFDQQQHRSPALGQAYRMQQSQAINGVGSSGGGGYPRTGAGTTNYQSQQQQRRGGNGNHHRTNHRDESRNNDDHGFSQMTSVLLNMLDTPHEDSGDDDHSSAQKYGEDDYAVRRLKRNVGGHRQDDETRLTHSRSQLRREERLESSLSSFNSSDANTSASFVDGAMMRSLSLQEQPSVPPGFSDHRQNSGGVTALPMGWSKSANHISHPNDNGVRMRTQQQQSLPTTNHRQEPNVGLYVP